MNVIIKRLMKTYYVLTICILLGIESMNENKEGSQVAHITNESKNIHLFDFDVD
jgi:hypothetical protein